MITTNIRTAFVSLAGAAVLCGTAVPVAGATQIDPTAKTDYTVTTYRPGDAGSARAGGCAVGSGNYVKSGTTVTVETVYTDGSETSETATCNNGSWNFS